jgi:uncharacterized membrane protein
MPDVDSSVPSSSEKLRDAVTRSFEQFTFERLVGGRLYAILGCLIVGIGLIMLLKYGIDHQWFSLAPSVRCFGVGVIGLGMIGVGELVRKRLGTAGTLAAAGIAGAGLAAIHGSVLAAFGMYHLIGQVLAFTLLALVSVGGIAYGLHARSLALAVLSLVGAYLNPICLVLMGVKETSPLAMPAYLVALLVLGLTLAGWRPRPYRWLRGVAWWGTAIVGSLWVIGTGVEHPFIGLAFLGLVWVLVHAEMYVGARRVPEGADVPLGPSNPAVRLLRPMITSFATTIWSVGGGVLLVQFCRVPTGIEGWHITCAGTVGAGVLAILLAGHLRVFRDAPETDAERLGIALWAQAGALLIATVAMGVHDHMQAVAWLAMGLGALAAGRWVRGRALEGYGLVVLAIAVGRLIAWDSWNFGGSHEQFHGLVLTGWSVLMLAAGASWCGAAWLLHRPSAGTGEPGYPSLRRTKIVNLCVAIGLTLPFIGLINVNDRGASLAVAGAVWGLLLMIASRVRDSGVLRYAGVIGLALVSFISAGMQLLNYGAADWSWSLGPIVFTDWGVVLVVMAAAWLVGAWLLGTSRSSFARPAAIVSIDMGVAMAMLSMIADGTAMGAVCIVWTVIALVLVAVHTRARSFGLDVVGLVVLVFAAGAWVNEYIVKEDWFASTAGGLAHPGLWVALAIAAAMIGACAWLRRGRPMRATWWPSIPTMQAVAGLVLLVSTSLEVSRSGHVWFPSSEAAQAGALTIWWGIFAVGLLVTGFAATIPIVRHLGLGLLGLATFKAVFFDLIHVGQEWRIASFIGLGLLMLGVAVAYAKVSAKLDRLIKAERGG